MILITGCSCQNRRGWNNNQHVTVLESTRLNWSISTSLERRQMNIPDEMNCWSWFPAMVGYAACYEALAEECMELAHCALKLARVLRGDNPVKEGGRNYLDKLDEEYTDVVSCAIALELKPNADISVWKWERHKKRLEEMEGK